MRASFNFHVAYSMIDLQTYVLQYIYYLHEEEYLKG